MRSIKSCNVAVVGGAGFLGSHLTNHLVDDRACQVLVLDNLCVGRREWVHPKARFLHCDITVSEEYLRNVFKENKIRFVANYAAFPYIPDSFVRPKHVFSVNASGAINVINAAQEAGVEGILQVSSAEIYGAGQNGKADEQGMRRFKLTEDAAVCPHSTYGAAKAAVDYYCQSAWRERQTPVIVLRQFNCLGERESHPYVVPEIISQLYDCAGGESPDKATTAYVQLGNNSFRDFLYAGDAVRIAVELLERGQWGEVYNLGSETGIKIYDLAKLIGKVMGFADVIVEQDSARVRPWEIWSLLSSNEKIYGIISRRSLVSLEDSLKKTVVWYESVGRKWPWEKQDAKGDIQEART